MADEAQPLYSTSKALAVEYHFYVDDAIYELEPFYELVTTLRESSPDDYVFIHFNSEGGSVYTCLQLVHAIRSSRATVVGCADGLVASAASAMFFACNAYQVNPAAQFLIHSGRCSERGKPADNKISADFYHKQIENLLNTVYGDFITEDEAKDVLAGLELYLTGEQVEERIKAISEEVNDQ